MIDDIKIQRLLQKYFLVLSPQRGRRSRMSEVNRERELGRGG